jgi:hypothetical protein
MNKVGGNEGKRSQTSARAGRLAVALRENLRRRKAQARGRAGDMRRADKDVSAKDGESN